MLSPRRRRGVPARVDESRDHHVLQSTHLASETTSRTHLQFDSTLLGWRLELHLMNALLRVEQLQCRTSMKISRPRARVVAALLLRMGDYHCDRQQSDHADNLRGKAVLQASRRHRLLNIERARWRSLPVSDLNATD